MSIFHQMKCLSIIIIIIIIIYIYIIVSRVAFILAVGVSCHSVGCYGSGDVGEGVMEGKWLWSDDNERLHGGCVHKMAFIIIIIHLPCLSKLYNHYK